MIPIFKTLGGALSLALLAAGSVSAQYPDTVKIMTYNINYEGNKGTQYEGIVTAIKAIDPTIAGLQKLDSCNNTATKPCYVAQLLGEQTNMSYTWVTGDPTEYGDGFLTKQPPKSVRKIKLTGNATYPRAALEIGVTVGGEAVRVFVTHLDISGAATRTSEAQQIISWMDSGGARTIPAVIMADYNAQSTEACMKVLTDAGFVFLKTSTGAILDTAQKINHLLYRPENRWKVVDVGNPAYSASNRYPLWGLMALQNPTGVAAQKIGTCGSSAPRISAGGNAISCLLPVRAALTLRLYDPSGRQVAVLAAGKLLEAGKHTFGIGSLAKGTYFLESAIGGASAIEKVVIDR
jgi:endonuclease/exonuclease/phosphatase family metal-dependent hydrolase